MYSLEVEAPCHYVCRRNHFHKHHEGEDERGPHMAALHSGGGSGLWPLERG